MNQLDDDSKGSPRRSLVVTVLMFIVLVAVLFAGIGLAYPDRYPTPMRAEGLIRIAAIALVVGSLGGIVSWYFQRHPPRQRKLSRDELIVWAIAAALLFGASVLFR